MLKKGEKILFCFLGQVTEYTFKGQDKEGHNKETRFFFVHKTGFAILKLRPERRKQSAAELLSHGHWCLT